MIYLFILLRGQFATKVVLAGRENIVQIGIRLECNKNRVGVYCRLCTAY